MDWNVSGLMSWLIPCICWMSIKNRLKSEWNNELTSAYSCWIYVSIKNGLMSWLIPCICWMSITNRLKSEWIDELTSALHLLNLYVRKEWADELTNTLHLYVCAHKDTDWSVNGLTRWLILYICWIYVCMTPNGLKLNLTK